MVNFQRRPRSGLSFASERRMRMEVNLFFVRFFDCRAIAVREIVQKCADEASVN